jgi:PAS domain-containing protein
VGVSIRSAKSHVPICEGVPAAVAVVDESGTVRFATRGFVDRFELREDALIDCPREVEEVAGARADRKTASLDGLEASLVAVTDGDGRRMAALTIPAIPGEGPAERTSPVLDEPLDESPAIIWLKDLDGRYLRINSRYAKQLQTDPDDVCGRTDAELTAASSIEGMRLEEKDIVGGEPLELEYLIGAFEDRPAFAALRFALRDGDGEPTATCSVAAPIADAALARSECDRLMRIDRWARLDAIAIRQELLDEWGLAVADGSSGPPLDRDDRVAAALVERDDAIATIERIEAELEREREQRDGLRSESELAARRAPCGGARGRVVESPGGARAAPPGTGDARRRAGGARGQCHPLERPLPAGPVSGPRRAQRVALGPQPRDRHAGRRGRVGCDGRLVCRQAAPGDEVRRLLAAGLRGSGRIRDSRLAVRRGCRHRRVRSCPQPDGDGLPAQPAVGRGQAAA